MRPPLRILLQEAPIANVIILGDVPELIQLVNEDPGLAQLDHPGILEAHLGSVMIRIMDYDGSQVSLVRCSNSHTVYSCLGVCFPPPHHVIRRSAYSRADVCGHMAWVPWLKQYLPASPPIRSRE